MSSMINYNIHNNMLIIGKASTNHCIKEILYWNNPDAVNKAYGEKSSLAKAFNEAFEIGVSDIFLMNIQKKRDYLDIIDIIKQNDFAYVVFTDLYITDKFNDAADVNIHHNFMAYILGTIGPEHDTVFFITDKHASLFETIDDFVEYMNDGVATFKSMCSGRANLENIIVVGNNLKDHEFANVTLAAAVCTTPINKYPSADFGEPVFYIEPNDNPRDFAYFKPQTVVGTTVENLLNCLEYGAQKVFPVSRILKYIKRGVDYTEFKGRLYSAYIKLRINKKLDEFLNSLVGVAINRYEIQDIVAYKGDPGTVNIRCYFSVQPAFCFELCQIEKELTI